jgi:hypothetical protein
MIVKYAMLWLTVAVILSVSVIPAYAEIYIIMFKEPAENEERVIDPPNKMNSGKTPFGEPTSGQSREDVAVKLNLKDSQVLYILDGLNGVIVELTEAEALRLASDERVLRITPDRIAKPAGQNPEPVRTDEAETAEGYVKVSDNLQMKIPCAAYEGNNYSFTLDYYPNPDDPAGVYWKMNRSSFTKISPHWKPTPVGDYPTYDYENGILTIPRVDTPEQAGMFQDARMELTGEGHWLLTGLKTAGTSPFATLLAQKVEMVVTETFPVQVFLKVGVLKDHTVGMGKIAQRLKGNHFEVVMYAEDPTPESNDSLHMMGYFEKIIPLSVYGLKAGTYEYSLNGVAASGDVPLTGTFVLTRDNNL